MKVIDYIGQNTLGFYFMSGALPAVLSPLFHRLIPGRCLFGMIGEWLTCVVVAFFVVKNINKWLPWMFDMRLLKLKTIIRKNKS